MKILKTFLSLFLCICLLAGCQNTTELSAKEIAEGLKELSTAVVNWVELDKSKISTYFGFTDENITDFKGYLNSSEEKFDMIAVFKFEDKATREDILKGINTLTTQMNETYRLTNQIESDKIDHHIVAEAKNTVIFCVMDTNSKIERFITQDVGAEILP